jgi:hypothetical protein
MRCEASVSNRQCRREAHVEEAGVSLCRQHEDALHVRGQIVLHPDRHPEETQFLYEADWWCDLPARVSGVKKQSREWSVCG